jgi:hypothetical protein
MLLRFAKGLMAGTMRLVSVAQIAVQQQRHGLE